MRFAILNGSRIVNTIVADWPGPAGALLLASPAEDAVGIGWTFDGSQFVAPTTTAESRSFTPLELIGPGGILTDAEKAAIVVAAAASPSVNLWLVALAAAERIVVDDPRTVAGFQFAIAQGLLTAERVAEILAP